MNVSPGLLSPSEQHARATTVAQTVSAVVFREVLKPLATALGPVGDVVLDGIVDRVLVRPKP